MADLSLEQLFENCEFNRLRFLKSFREFEEIQEKLYAIQEKEIAAVMRRIRVGSDAVKLPNFKGQKTRLKNRRKVVLAIHASSCDQYGRDLQRIAQIIEGRGEEWKNGAQDNDE